MTKSEILKELEESVKEMELLIRKQPFNVVDAYKFLDRSYNIYRSLEDMQNSRDKWKAKYQALLNTTRKDRCKCGNKKYKGSKKCKKCFFKKPTKGVKK